MILPSGAFCLIRSKHVCSSKDEPDKDGRFCDVPSPLKPGDHHWATVDAEVWHSAADQAAGKPSVLLCHVQVGHRLYKQLGSGLVAYFTKQINAHYVGGSHGDTRDARWHHVNQVKDILGLLNEPGFTALEVTPETT